MRTTGYGKADVSAKWAIRQPADAVCKWQNDPVSSHGIHEALFLASHCAALTTGPARIVDYFPSTLPFRRRLEIKTTEEFGVYARRIFASLAPQCREPNLTREHA